MKTVLAAVLTLVLFVSPLSARADEPPAPHGEEIPRTEPVSPTPESPEVIPSAEPVELPPPAEPPPPPTPGASPPPASASPQWGRGPFEVADPFILATLRGTTFARSPEVPGNLRLVVGGRGVWENSFAFERDTRVADPATGGGRQRLILDAETRTLDLVARLGVLDRLELGVELRALEWRGGGQLDRVVRQFHRTAGIGQLDRDKRPNDAYLVTGVDTGGRAFTLEGRGTRLGDAALSARALLTAGDKWLPAVTLGLRATVPTASAGFEHADGTAVTLQADLSKRIADLPFLVYASAAYTYSGDARTANIVLARHRGFYSFGIEWEITQGVSLVAHFWQETPREYRIWGDTSIAYGNYVTYIAGGLKVQPIEGLTIELGIVENAADPSTTGDIGVLFNVWYRTPRLGAAAPR